jgi:serine/threonine-protein phosphatase PGAM5
MVPDEATPRLDFCASGELAFGQPFLMRAPLPRRLLSFLLFVSWFAASLAQTEPGTRSLYLIRHGFYDYVAGANDRTGNALNSLGREQAGCVAERLASFPIKFTGLVSSEFTRARETGDLIAEKLGQPCRRDARLNEITPPGAGLKPEQLDAGAEEQLRAAWEHFAAPNAAGDTHEVLVCHGNVIRWFVCRALGVDTKQWTRFEIANCSITLIQVRPDGSTRVQLFNEIAHVPVEKQTWSGRGPAWPLPAQPKAR